MAVLFNVGVEVRRQRLDRLRVQAARHQAPVGVDLRVRRDDAESEASVGELPEEDGEEACEHEDYADY